MEKMPMVSPDSETATAAASLVGQAIDLLSEADQYRAVPYLKLGVAVLFPEKIARADPNNESAMNLLRMALVLLERDGEDEAAEDVESALIHLGEPFPLLSDIEANAKMDWWDSRYTAAKSLNGNSNGST